MIDLRTVKRLYSRKLEKGKNEEEIYRRNSWKKLLKLQGNNKILIV